MRALCSANTGFSCDFGLVHNGRIPLGVRMKNSHKGYRLGTLDFTGKVGDRQFYDTHGVLLLTNDELIAPGHQAFPGERLPESCELGLGPYPVPDRPGEYFSKEEFLAAPKYMAQFVHWSKRLELALQGRYFEISPVHFEGIFTLVCNFMCPHCTRRVTRTRWIARSTWDENSHVDEHNTMGLPALCRSLEQIASLSVDSQMGIVWGGGEPTANPATYDAMLYAKNLGLTSSLLTNGVYLDVDRALDAEPVLIRISLNCGTENEYRRFHGYRKGLDYFERTKLTMRKLAQRKQERQVSTLVGFSLIIDERNTQDILETARLIRRVAEEAGGGVDYVIARPVMNYRHFDYDWARLKPDTKDRTLDLVSVGGAIHEILSHVNIPVVPIKDSFGEPPTREADFYDTSDCLAYGLCSEIRHNGDVQLCSDSYGNPDYTIGNLLDDSLDEIWRSDRRRDVLSRINENACFLNRCPHNSRGHHYNRLFHRIEIMRKEGRLSEVRRWASDLRKATLPLGHSFFI